jgi:hypothetical protein
VTGACNRNRWFSFEVYGLFIYKEDNKVDNDCQQNTDNKKGNDWEVD